MKTVVTSEEYRAVMGHFATGVTVITAAGPEGPVGLTANAVCSLSLEPLLLLACFDNAARTLPVIRAAGRFGVNVLADDQEDVAQVFASKRRETHKYIGIAHSVHDGIPVLEGALAWVGCDATEWIPGGDHTIAIAAVTAAEAGAGEPLIFYRGRYERLS